MRVVYPEDLPRRDVCALAHDMTTHAPGARPVCPSHTASQYAHLESYMQQQFMRSRGSALDGAFLIDL